MEEGSASGHDWLGSLTLMPLGYALDGVLADHIDAPWVFIGAGVINLALTTLGVSARGIRKLP